MVKTRNYTQILSSVKAVIESEENLIANLANTCAILHNEFNFWWTGFYLVDNQELILGPFQGPLACTRITHGKGVCGAAWKEKQTQVVPNVHEFPGHIACSSESNSEIVVPIFNSKNEVVAVLDIDSKDYNAFDESDRTELEELAQLLKNKHWA
jgi:GAF domain-containing protein